MRIILAGAGRLGREMAQVLVAARNEVTLVEQDDELVEQLKGRLKTKTLLGDACEPSVLEEAGALNTDILMATTGDDEDNLVISLLAKRYFNVPRVVARVNYPENQWLLTDRWGVDVAVSPSSAQTEAIVGSRCLSRIRRRMSGPSAPRGTSRRKRDPGPPRAHLHVSRISSRKWTLRTEAVREMADRLPRRAGLGLLLGRIDPASGSV